MKNVFALCLRVVTATCVMASVAVGQVVRPPSGDESSDAGWMFDPSAVVDIDLTVPDSSMEQISCDMGAPRPYVPALFTMTYTKSSRGGTSMKKYGPWTVGIHTKGVYGSFRCLPEGEKAGLKVKFSSASHRIDGIIKKLTLNNMVQDPTMAKQTLCYDIFQAMGVASPRTGFARVSINGVYRGLYLNVETYDDVSLPRWYPSTKHLYEGSYGSWWGSVSNAYSGHYAVDEGDETDRDDLQLLIDTAKDNSPGWYARMAPIADLEQMTRMWATEWFIGHWDGYSTRLPNNYFLHSDNDVRFTMCPWGVDQTFEWASQPGVSRDAFLQNNCLTDPIGGSMYTDALRTVTSTVKGMHFNHRADAIYRVACQEGSSGVEEIKEFVARRIRNFEAWAANAPAVPRYMSVFSSRGKTWVGWRPPRVTTGITGYAVEYRSNSIPWTRVTVASTATSTTIMDLACGTYEFRIRSIIAEGSRVASRIERTHENGDGYWFLSPQTSLPLTKSSVRIR